MQKQTRTLLVILLVLSLLGCESDPTPPPPTSGGGFSIETQMETSPGSGILTFAAFVTVSGDWVADGFGAQGNPAHWQSTTDMVGFRKIWYARAPADWLFTWIAPGPCSGLSALGRVKLEKVMPFSCVFQRVFGSSFSFSPDPLYSDAAPAVVTVAGEGISSQYGMPLLQYFDSSGNLVAQTNAIGVAEDGTWLEALSPNELASIPAGTYFIYIKNANASGGWDFIGVVTVDLVTPTPPPPPPPDPEPCSPDPCIIQ